MAYFDNWRQQLKQDLATFSLLINEDRNLDLIYGITAAAVLWGVREASFNDDQRSALRLACGDEKHLPHLLRAIGGWDAMTHLEAARNLSMRQDKNNELRVALTTLMGTFIEELLAAKMIQHQHFDISGAVTGGNIVIGGYQIVAGDLIVQYNAQQKIRACPTAPKPPAHFAGRRDELTRLKEVLRQGQNVAITGIQGVGGIGKTVLSLQLAFEMSEFSAVLWASLGPNPNAINHLIEWARHADPDFDPHQDNLDILVGRVQALLTNLIQDQCPGRVLVILDDIWEGDSTQAARILQKAAPVNSVSLITTRSQLVVAQLRSTRLELHPMTPTDSLKMLRNLLSDYPDIPDANLLELSEVVGYHPLAMELAAGQISLLERPGKEIADLIVRYRGGIPEGSPFRDIGLELGEDREDNLEIVLAYSYDVLSKTEQAQFRALGVLSYNVPFDHDICRVIWGVDDPKPILDKLRHYALVGIAENDGWYQQHVLLRSYARAMLKHNEEFKSVFEKYGQCIGTLTNQFPQLPIERWKDRLSSYYSHIDYYGNQLFILFNEAWDHDKVALSDSNTPVALPDDLPDLKSPSDKNLAFTIFNGDSNTTEALPDDLLDLKFLTNTSLFFIISNFDQFEIKPILEAALLFVSSGIGHYIHYQSIDKQGLDWLRLGLISAKTLQNHDIASFCVHSIAVWMSDHAYYEDALTYLSVNHSQVNTDQEAIRLNSIGSTYLHLGRIKEAQSILEKSLSITQSRTETKADTLNNLGRLHDDLGNSKTALTYFEQSLALYRTINNRLGEILVINNIGKVHVSLGEYHLASLLFHEALNLVRPINLKDYEALVLNGLGVCYIESMDYSEALNSLEQSLSIRQSIGDRSGEISSLSNIANLYMVVEDYQKAIPYLEKAKEIAQLTSQKPREAAMLVGLAFLYNKIHEWDLALETAQKGLTILEDLNLTQDRAGITQQQYLDLIDEIKRGKMGEKIEKPKPILIPVEQLYKNTCGEFHKDLFKYRQAGNITGEAITLKSMGRCYSDMGDRELALAFYTKALLIFESLSDKGNQASTLNNMGFEYHNQNKLEEALQYYLKALDIFKAAEDKPGEGDALNNIGAVYHSLEQRQKAFPYYQQAITIRHEVGNIKGEVETLRSMAVCYYLDADIKKALELMKHAVELATSINHSELSVYQNELLWLQQSSSP